MHRSFAAALMIPMTVLVAASRSEPTDHGASSRSNQAIAATVDSAARKFLAAAPQVTRVSIGIVADGEFHNFNYRRPETDEENAPTARSLYPIASISKTFTGTLLAQAQIEGKLRLNDDVRKYLDGAYPNLEYQAHAIKIEMLVNHLSGLPFNLPDIAENRPPFAAPVSPAVEEMLRHYTRADFLADLHKVKLDRPPGEKFSYSNAGAILASIVLERIYGKTYEELVIQKIVWPLGMTDTVISPSPEQHARLIKGYDENGKLVSYPPEITLGAGGLNSTASDLLKYAQWQMDTADPVVRLSHNPTFTYNNYSMGLNWQIIHAETAQRIWQEGEIPGFSSLCMVLPEFKVGLVVLANTQGKAASAALSALTKEISLNLRPAAAPLF